MFSALFTPTDEPFADGFTIIGNLIYSSHFFAKSMSKDSSLA